jgi:hypothetical protein
MNWLMYLSWFAGPLLQITLSVFMVRRGFHKLFPRFFTYIVFQTLKSTCLFIAFRFFPNSNELYFDAYWTGNAISVLLTVAVMDEILRNLFKEYGGVQIVGTTIFRWSCGLLLVLAILSALSNRDGAADTVVAAVFGFERGVRVMQVGLFLLLMLLSRALKNCWRQPVFGIALGFGVFASVELILVSFVLSHGNIHGAKISLIKSMAYNVVTIVWAGYLSQRPERVPAVDEILPVGAPAMAFAGSEGIADGDLGFMLRVEQAVDRVLSRSDWPRSNVETSQVIIRRPRPEDNN